MVILQWWVMCNQVNHQMYDMIWKPLPFRLIMFSVVQHAVLPWCVTDVAILFRRTKSNTAHWVVLWLLSVPWRTLDCYILSRCDMGSFLKRSLFWERTFKEKQKPKDWEASK